MEKLALDRSCHLFCLCIRLFAWLSVCLCVCIGVCVCMCVVFADRPPVCPSVAAVVASTLMTQRSYCRSLRTLLQSCPFILLLVTYGLSHWTSTCSRVDTVAVVVVVVVATVLIIIIIPPCG